ncbi:MAG: helix-turn-helix domain-containing protein [Clostridiales bacterium]|nr:helix-turn-helix domain-containing protein [Clostridiales bacterium]
MFIKTFGCCRKVYNLMLADKIESYKTTGRFAAVTPAKYKKDYPYLKEVDSLIQQIIRMETLRYSIMQSNCLKSVK